MFPNKIVVTMKGKISLTHQSNGQRSAGALMLACQKNLQIDSQTRVPMIAPYSVEKLPGKLLNFSEATSSKCSDYDAIVHFYTHDWRFIPLFKNPEKYVCKLQKFAYVITPDMSQYREMPYFSRYFANCMNNAMGSYLQDNGVNVIANVSWSLPDSYEYAFAGIPKHSTIAINSNGAMADPVSKNLWMMGYEEAIQVLKPERVIRYGSKMPNEREEISVYFENQVIRRMRYGC